MTITDAMVEVALKAFWDSYHPVIGYESDGPTAMRAALEAAYPKFTAYVDPKATLLTPQSEPVAWQIRTRLTKGNWTFWLGDARPDVDEHFYEVRPLYTYESRDG